MRIIAVLLLLSPGILLRGSSPDSYRRLLGKYVDHYGRVAYTNLYRDPLFSRARAGFIRLLRRPGFGRRRKALLINAYNFFILEKVRRHWPLRRVTAIPAFFTDRFVPVAGNSLSLDGLEKRYLYRLHPDPLLHFVLVCAARSCPPLARTPYTARSLDRQLRNRARLFLRSRQGMRQRGNRLYLSRIFKWYGRDFGGYQGIRRFLKRYGALSSIEKIHFLRYDWTLNSQ